MHVVDLLGVFLPVGRGIDSLEVSAILVLSFRVYQLLQVPDVYTDGVPEWVAQWARLYPNSKLLQFPSELAGNRVGGVEQNLERVVKKTDFGEGVGAGGVWGSTQFVRELH